MLTEDNTDIIVEHDPVVIVEHDPVLSLLIFKSLYTKLMSYRRVWVIIVKFYKFHKHTSYNLGGVTLMGGLCAPKYNHYLYLPN